MSKKFLVVGAAVVTTLVLLFAACAQPTEFDGASISINNYGVEPPLNVKAEAYLGVVVVTWEAPKSAISGYRLIRQRTDSSEEPVVINSPSSSTTRYIDSTLTGPTKLVDTGKYVYTVAAYINAGNQGVGAAIAESTPAEEVTVSIPARGTKLDNPAVPSYEVVSSYPASTAVGNTTFDYKFKISGLNPAYTYNVQIQYNDTPTSPAGWTNEGFAMSIPVDLSNVGFDGTAYSDQVTITRTASTTRVYRVVATVGVNTSNPYNNNHGWVIADTSIPTATDPYLNAANKIQLTGSGL